MTPALNAPCPCGSGRKYKRCCVGATAATPQDLRRPTGKVSVRALLQEAMRHHASGRVEEAEALYRQALAVQADNVDALHLLGVAARQRGALNEASDLIGRAIALRPAFAEAHGNLGMVLDELGRKGEAVDCYRRALALNPALAETWFNLGNALRDLGRREDAIAAYRGALARKPIAEGHRNLGNLLLAQGAHAEAAASLRQALALRPDLAEAWNGLGCALQGLRQFEEAIVCHHRATQLEPELAEAHNNLGNALKDHGRAQEAVLCYQRALALRPDLIEAWNNLGNALHTLGRVDEALRSYRQAIALKPEFAEVHVNIGNILKMQGHLDEAAYCFGQALSLKPGFVEAHNNLGVVLTEQGRHTQAIAHLQQALALKPGFAEAHNNLGNVYKNQGRLEEAMSCFRQALTLRPDYSGAHSNLLFTLNYVDGIAPAQIFAMHRHYNAMHAAPMSRSIAPHANTAEPQRRLKVGYLSPDFRSHACAFFVEPLLAHHDRDAVEVYAYAEVAHPDAVTARLRALTDHWRSTVGLSDEQVAAQIRADGIDILIDLAGHTANSRLLALARKPAPVQATWLGYPATTGLDTMDYRLTDACAEPPGMCEQYYTERLVRLPHSLWCYRPFADMPEVSPLPALRNGHVTFGSFNNFAKVGPRVIDLWARVLLATPGSRLAMITVPAGETQERVKERFAALGVAPERLLLHDRLARAQYLELFSRVDVALDPFPCNGGTTTCDALWMGLPLLTLIGDTFLSRASYSLLSAAGLGAFAAETPAAYLELAARMGADLGALAAVRDGLREHLRASPLIDAAAFARDIEAAYRDMWQRWCAAAARP